MEEEYDLTKSSKALGKLYPILKDKDGNIIDGFHRRNADPDWQSITLENIDTPVKLELARLATNFCRRTLKATEMEQRIAFLIKNGMKPEEIADETGISRATIYRHMPQELKDQNLSEATSKAKSELSRQSVSSDTPNRDTCDNCHVSMSTEDLKGWNGNKLCGRCYAQALDHPAQFHQRLEPQNQLLKRKPKDEELNNLMSCNQCGRTIGIMNAKNFDGKDLCPSCYDKSINSKGERQSRMQTGISKMDQEMLVRLQNNQILRQNGWKIEFQKPYHITTLISDLSLTKDTKEIAVFFDGPCHLRKEDRDEYNRGKLESRFPNTKTLSLPYKTATEKEFERLEEKVVKEAV